MLRKASISMIVAISENNGIGKNNKLLTYLPKDLQWFKKNTLDKTIVMGRKTFVGLPAGALPRRKNIVLSEKKDFKPINAMVISNFAEVFNLFDMTKENFVIGGEQIYRLFLPFADKLYITKIKAFIEADKFFPKIDFTDWNLIHKVHNFADEKHKYDFDFLIYDKN